MSAPLGPAASQGRHNIEHVCRDAGSIDVQLFELIQGVYALQEVGSVLDDPTERNACALVAGAMDYLIKQMIGYCRKPGNARRPREVACYGGGCDGCTSFFSHELANTSELGQAKSTILERLQMEDIWPTEITKLAVLVPIMQNCDCVLPAGACR